MKPLVAAMVVMLVFGGLVVPQSSRSDLTLRSVTRLVQITVIAQDDRSQPVTDLKRDDFLLFDSGKPRDIKVFTMDRMDRQQPSAAVETGVNPSARLFTNSEREGLDRLA
jgi:hypothetical protein